MARAKQREMGEPDSSVLSTVARATYMRFLERFDVDGFKLVPSLFGREYLAICEDRLVQCSLIGNDFGDEFANVAVVCKSHFHVAVAHDGHRLRESSRVVLVGQTGNDHLIPPANIDDSVWNLECFDVVQESFFLEAVSVSKCTISVRWECL